MAKQPIMKMMKADFIRQARRLLTLSPIRLLKQLQLRRKQTPAWSFLRVGMHTNGLSLMNLIRAMGLYRKIALLA
jgi:hypothetical protein